MSTGCFLVSDVLWLSLDASAWWLGISTLFCLCICLSEAFLRISVLHTGRKNRWKRVLIPSIVHIHDPVNCCGSATWKCRFCAGGLRKPEEWSDWLVTLQSVSDFVTIYSWLLLCYFPVLFLLDFIDFVFSALYPSSCFYFEYKSKKRIMKQTPRNITQALMKWSGLKMELSTNSPWGHWQGLR